MIKLGYISLLENYVVQRKRDNQMRILRKFVEKKQYDEMLIEKEGLLRWFELDGDDACKSVNT